MKSRQLANVLIKILGLSLLVHGITPAVQMFWQIYGPAMSARFSENLQGYLLASLLPAGIGITLIWLSSTLAEILFTEEE